MNRGSLTPCPACACHVTASERVCPFCDASIESPPTGRATTAVSLLLKLAVAVGLPASASACYGMPSTIRGIDTPPSSATEGGATQSGDGGAGGQGGSGAGGSGG
ncbi:MAG: hypothetical protein FJ096_07110 [Deltaproteobacteria bacterium]|nr:hypothetical protein [Deltaproteobacteria bacterium]